MTFVAPLITSHPSLLTHHKYMTRLLITIFFLCATAFAGAQEKSTGFAVKSFRVLANDVTAFISPVRDLNDEACALIKVVAPADFAFSTPLGIMKREDNIGEIWLYMPKGTKTLTIKHPQWGVLRDYPLGMKLDSHTTYELRLSLPLPQDIALHDTIVMTKTITDTIRVETRRKPVPLSVNLLATAALHSGNPSWGLMAMMLWRHGFYIHASADLHSTGTTRLTCDNDGYVDGTQPYYTGKTWQSNYTLTAGAAHRLSGRLALFEGVGYGRAATAWQLAESEGGGRALNNGLTHKGLSGEAGLLYSYKRLCISASVITIAGKQWQGSIGVGIKLGKQ